MANTDGASGAGPTGLAGMGIGGLGVGNLLDTVEFVQNAWSSFGVPSSLTPTTDVDELDRRIADLKTVEQWLRMNLSLLETSVQALEIQRGTIVALKAYGDMLGSQAQSLPGAAALAEAMATVAAGTMPRMTIPDPTSGDASTPATASSRSAERAAQTPAAEMAAAASGEAPPHPRPGSVPANPGLDAAAWWDLLNRQFSQIATAALGAASAVGAAGAAPAKAGATAAGETGARGSREGAPVARSRKAPSGAKTQVRKGSRRTKDAAR